jgi:phosphohistidine phosphatase
MKLYLMRHAEAEFGEPMDPTRKLTPTGKRQAKMMGKWLNRQTDKPELIVQSNLHRSQSTAKRVAKQIDAPIVTAFQLDPDGSPEAAWRYLRKLAKEKNVQGIVAVTHGPLVEKILAMLIGTPSVGNLRFAHGAVAHFDTTPSIIREAAGEYTYDEVEQKRWVLGSGGASGENCDICEGNADMGWIDMDDVFDSTDGDIDDAPAHPNCDCTVEQKTKRVRVYESGVREAEEYGQLAYFHWLVTPNTVARDEDEMDAVAEAALALIGDSLVESEPCLSST